MVVIMKNNASEEEVEAVITNLNAFGFDVHRSSGVSQTVLGAIGVWPGFDHKIISGLSGVADVQRVTEPYKLASRAARGDSSIIDLDGVQIGGNTTTVMAALSSIQSTDQFRQIVTQIVDSGVSVVRVSVMKPRTSFYEYQELQEEQLKLMCQVSVECGVKLILEMDSTEFVDRFYEDASILQVGARNMQNFELLRALGELNRPVLLERGLAATVEEWIMSAEYIMKSGNSQVILCERGIRTFEIATQHTLDLSGVSVAKAKSHLPVMVDPSQGVGIRDYVLPMACAAVAAGADGVIIDVHDHSLESSESGLQSLDLDQLSNLLHKIGRVAHATE